MLHTVCVCSSEPVYAFSMETLLSYFRKDSLIYIRIFSLFSLLPTILMDLSPLFLFPI